MFIRTVEGGSLGRCVSKELIGKVWYDPNPPSSLIGTICNVGATCPSERILFSSSSLILTWLPCNPVNHLSGFSLAIEFLCTQGVKPQEFQTKGTAGDWECSQEGKAATEHVQDPGFEPQHWAQGRTCRIVPAFLWATISLIILDSEPFAHCKLSSMWIFCSAHCDVRHKAQSYGTFLYPHCPAHSLNGAVT